MTNKPSLSPPSDWIMQQAQNWPDGARILDFALAAGGIAARLIMLFQAGFHSWPLTAIMLHWRL
jgi:hypothetical protein